MLLSICIPNYNRIDCLNNCLNSVKIAKKYTKLKLEVCISDNNSEENIIPIIKKYKKYINIKFKKIKKFRYGEKYNFSGRDGKRRIRLGHWK